MKEISASFKRQLKWVIIDLLQDNNTFGKWEVVQDDINRLSVNWFLGSIILDLNNHKLIMNEDVLNIIEPDSNKVEYFDTIRTWFKRTTNKTRISLSLYRQQHGDKTKPFEKYKV